MEKRLIRVVKGSLRIHEATVVPRAGGLGRGSEPGATVNMLRFSTLRSLNFWDENKCVRTKAGSLQALLVQRGPDFISVVWYWRWYR